MRTRSPGITSGPVTPGREAQGAEHAPATHDQDQLGHSDEARAQPFAIASRVMDAYRLLRSRGGDQKSRYRTLLDAVPDAVTLHDERGRILDANTAAIAVYGYTAEQLRHLDVNDLNPDLPRNYMRQVMRTCRPGQAFFVETVNCRADGSRFPVEVHSNAFRDGDRWLVLAVARDVTARAEVERKLRVSAEALKHQATIDKLTGLPNRDCIIKRIDHAVRNAADRNGAAVLYVDIDRFKVINDLLGHAAGDRLLRSAAHRLRECARDTAEVARYGNDEFIVLIECTTDNQQACKLADRIIQAFATSFRHADEEFALTLSIGIAQYPQHGVTTRRLLHHADAAMYDAKRRGRNTWQAFNQELARDLSLRLRIESQLRLALENHELRLEYQPQISLVDNSIIGVEALLRWHNHSLGELMPEQFVQHAENSGEIVRIGAWIIHEACRQLREWLDAGLVIARVAVNVSFRQLLSGNLCASVRQALDEYDLPGAALELEMTERTLIDDAPDIMEVFAGLKRLGVTLSIDDFGEGYSSLNYLRQLPIDGIKISHTFMHRVTEQGTESTICQALVQIGKTLGLDVVAEGVETEEQHAFLLDLGAPSAQGFLYSRPLAVSELPAFVKHWRQRHPPAAPDISSDPSPH